MTKLILHSEERKQEIQDEFQKKYITTAEIQRIVFPESGEQRNIKRKNRVSDERNALAQMISRGNFPSAIQIKSGYLLWDRDHFHKNRGEKDIENRISKKFTDEFNDKYIAAPEIKQRVEADKNQMAAAIKKNTLPHAFQIPVSRYWMWLRKDIETYLKPLHEYNKYIKKNRKRRKNGKNPIKSFNEDVQKWMDFVEKTKGIIDK
jgi:predicted DNA-binding transcriptional regulator AlpA